MTERQDLRLAEFDEWNERLEAQHNRIMKHVRMIRRVGVALFSLTIISCIAFALVGQHDVALILGWVCLMIIAGAGVMISVSIEPAKRDGEKFLRALRAYRQSLRDT